MATVERVQTKRGTSWKVRWRAPDGRARAKRFPRKVLADRYRAFIERELAEQTYLDPDAGQVTLAEWSKTWLRAQGHLKATTRARYEGVLAKHVLPRWGGYPLARIRHADVAAWVTRMSVDGHGPATIVYAYRVLSLMLDLAQRDGRIARNPAVGIKLPRKGHAERRFLTHRQVSDLADAAGRYGDLVLVLAYCGLRWGELAALRVGRVDLERRRLEVVESVTDVRGTPRLGRPEVPSTPLGALSRVPGSDARRAHERTAACRPRIHVASRCGAAQPELPPQCVRRRRTSAGLEGLTPHELRHTAASLAVGAGANVKAVQRMLGHASAAMTLDVYSGLFDDDLDEVARRLGREAHVSVSCPQPPSADGSRDATSP